MGWLHRQEPCGVNWLLPPIRRAPDAAPGVPDSSHAIARDILVANTTLMMTFDKPIIPAFFRFAMGGSRGVETDGGASGLIRPGTASGQMSRSGGPEMGHRMLLSHRPVAGQIRIPPQEPSTAAPHRPTARRPDRSSGAGDGVA
jgi:hypothetical protein